MSKKEHSFRNTPRSTKHCSPSTLRIALLPCLAALATAQAANAIALSTSEIGPSPVLTGQAAAHQVSTPTFNTAFLHGSASAADLRTLLAGSSIPEGVQRMDLYVNQSRIGRRDILFRANPLSGEVEPCLDLDIFEQIGIDITRLPQAPSPGVSCLRLPESVPQATATYEANQLRLYLSVPQIYLNSRKRGYVDPSLWDVGQTAGFLDYNINLRRDQAKSQSAYSHLGAGLRAGINIGAWRLRNNSHLSSSTGQPTSFSSQNTYAQRDIIRLKSQLLAGQSYTRSPIFNSVRFMGVQLLSDDAMRPDSEQGYAPVIRGTAESNATVEVRQNGYVIYTTTVAPGPFAINDLAPSGSNGDLDITIIEADGSRRTLRQAFSSPPLMVREGRLTYDIAAGQVRLNDELRERPAFVTGTMLYGMTANTTLAVGLQASQNFNAYSLGAGLNTPLGAFSIDGTQASSSIQGRRSQGTSVNVRYAKYIEQTASNIAINFQRDLNQGYRTLSDHVLASETFSDNPSYMPLGSHQRLDVNIGQALFSGNLYLNASYNKYWESTPYNSLSAGYSNRIGKLNYNLAYTRDMQFAPSGARSHGQAVMLTLSLPLGSGSNAPQSVASLNRGDSGSTAQAGVVGLLPTEQEISYAVSGNRTANGNAGGSASVGTATSFARMNVGYAYGNRFNSSNFSVASSIVAHSGGVNLGQSLGETVMLAKVDPPVPGVGISSQAGVKTGANGYAIIPNATPYRNNYVSLNTRSAPREAEFDNAVQQVAPTRGAISLATFKAQVGRRIQFELHDAQGGSLPFGAVVSDASGKQLGMTDPRGRILTLLTPSQEQGFLDIAREGKTCRARYSLPKRAKSTNYERISVGCTATL